MAYDVQFEASNTADFVLDVSATDFDTGVAIDFTLVSAATFQVVDDQDNVKLTAALSNGAISLVTGNLALEIAFTRQQMQTLCKGNYRMGMVYQISGGIVVPLFKGQLTIYDGIAVLQ